MGVLAAVHNKWAVPGAAMATVFLWGSAFPATRYSIEVYSPQALMLLRFLFACATLIIIGIAKKIRLPARRDLPLFALGGLVGVFLYMLFFKLGSVHVQAGAGSFIIASAPVFVLIFSTLILGERVRPLCWVGVAVSFVGLIVVTISQIGGPVLDIGVLMFVLATLASCFHNIIQRKIMRTYTALEATTYSMIFGTALMLIYLPMLWRELPGANLSVNLVVVYMGVFPAALAYLSWGWALSKTEKTTYVTVFLYLVPFIASVLAYFWLGEVLSLWALLGGGTIIAGMVVTNRAGRQVQDIAEAD